eukprot:TRINITY_DN35035_c0_g1_i5.p1 TRINITY_DN35035_c0_g1~~TRINITY_DN35035_c0_g1_i5.p1  ORF type:complete len:110 (+),score=12.68 TRINITY_DN35035_c0_g1_i5:513-842(+)
MIHITAMKCFKVLNAIRNKHTCTYMHAHMYACAHKQTHTHAHLHIHACTRVHTNKHTRMHAHTHTHTHSLLHRAISSSNETGAPKLIKGKTFILLSNHTLQHTVRTKCE